MRLAVTESCLLYCQQRLQLSIHLPARINYTSQRQITPHSFVCSHTVCMVINTSDIKVNEYIHMKMEYPLYSVK